MKIRALSHSSNRINKQLIVFPFTNARMQKNIPPSVFKFLTALKQHNNREWFAENKSTYLEQYDKVVNFADALIEKMNRCDHIETPSGKKAVYRIYKDIRFAKDKTPYKTHIAGSLARATKLLRGGYYFHIEPGNSFIAGGFWGPNPADLKQIREHIASDDKPLRKIINSKSFKTHFGTLKGEKLKTAPKGFNKADVAIDLLVYKQFLVSKPISDRVVNSPAYLDEMVKTFVAMRPFFDYMSEILTTNLNGEPLTNTQ
jgi:uncharacterized protein (TIGR02453 family)